MSTPMPPIMMGTSSPAPEAQSGSRRGFHAVKRSWPPDGVRRPLSPSRRLRGRGDELSGSCARPRSPCRRWAGCPAATSSMSARSLVTSRTLSASFSARPSAAAATVDLQRHGVVGHLAGHHQARASPRGGGAPRSRPPGPGCTNMPRTLAVWSARPIQPLMRVFAAPARAAPARQHRGEIAGAEAHPAVVGFSTVTTTSPTSPSAPGSPVPGRTISTDHAFVQHQAFARLVS